MSPLDHANARRGISLVELVGVMAAGAVLVSVAIAVFVAVVRSDRRFSERLDGQQSLTELTDRLRSDVHAAAEATWDDDTAVLRLERANGDRVEYALRSARCERREAPVGEDEWRLAGVYQMPARTDWSVSLDRLREYTLVRVGFTSPRPGPRRNGGRQQSEVVAVVRRDGELLHP